MPVAHRPAMLEAQVDVLILRGDVGEVRGAATDRQVVADQMPARADTFDGIRERRKDDVAESFRDIAHRPRVSLEQGLGRDRLFGGHLVDGGTRRAAAAAETDPWLTQ